MYINTCNKIRCAFKRKIERGGVLVSGVEQVQEAEVSIESEIESYRGEETSMKSGSNAIIGDHNGVVEYLSKVRSNSQRLGSENGGGEHSSKSMEKSQLSGSMRKEKEWERTLACKLFEERHRHSSSSINVEGGAEEMDLLWETYESTDSNKSKTKNRNEEEMEEGRLCCLPAMKFSAGKMNLGMRRPNLMSPPPRHALLVKISKALKGFGWLHLHHVTTKHGNKKVYP